MHEQIPQLANFERDRLIEGHQQYVKKIAAKVYKSLPMNVDFEELVGYGTIGLIEAAERFDARRGVSFLTFSYYRIRGSMFDGLRQMGYYNNSASKKRAWEANANDLLQTATDDMEINAEHATSVDDEIEAIGSLLDNLIPSYILSMDIDDMSEIPDYAESAIDSFEKKELLQIVLDVVSELSQEEQDLIRDIYFKNITMVKIAEKRGSNKSWISRLHSRAIQRIRDKLREKEILA